MFHPEGGRMAVLTEHPSDFASSDFLVVAADHPSLVEAREQFAATLRAEQRFFGRASADPKPFPSLIAKLLADDGLRLAAVVDGRIVGLTCLGADGEAAVAVVEDWRDRGVAAMGDALDATIVDLGRGRIELVFDTDSDARSA